MKEIKELEINPDLKLCEAAEKARSCFLKTCGNEEVKLVGWSFHFLIGENMGTISGWASGFDRNDYEE